MILGGKRCLRMYRAVGRLLVSAQGWKELAELMKYMFDIAEKCQ